MPTNRPISRFPSANLPPLRVPHETCPIHLLQQWGWGPYQSPRALFIVAIPERLHNMGVEWKLLGRHFQNTGRMRSLASLRLRGSLIQMAVPREIYTFKASNLLAHLKSPILRFFLFKLHLSICKTSTSNGFRNQQLLRSIHHLTRRFSLLASHLRRWERRRNVPPPHLHRPQSKRSK